MYCGVSRYWAIDIFGAGCVAALKLAGASFGQWEISIIWGLGVAMAIYLTAAISGAHLNPAVTIALWLFACFERRKFSLTSWHRLPAHLCRGVSIRPVLQPVRRF